MPPAENPKEWGHLTLKHVENASKADPNRSMRETVTLEPKASETRTKLRPESVVPVRASSKQASRRREQAGRSGQKAGPKDGTSRRRKSRYGRNNAV